MAEDESRKQELNALLPSFSGKPDPPQHTDERQFPEISREEYARFLDPMAMLKEMPFGMANMLQLGRELRAERYGSAADEVHWAAGGFTGREKLSRLPKWLWAIAMPDVNSDFWQTGYLEAWIPDKGGYPIPGSGNWLRLYGVRFWAPFLERTVAAEPDVLTATAVPSAISSRAGRPRKEFWEDLLVAIFDQLWHGELTPKTQADVEGAMHDWLSANGHDASERSVRQRAKSLWNVWIKEGNN